MKQCDGCNKLHRTGVNNFIYCLLALSTALDNVQSQAGYPWQPGSSIHQGVVTSKVTKVVTGGHM